ncbi:DUF982 domain-containing protein [Rhizobium sp. TRM96647]|uniref:DUF982 domain-containing protein n=1 Tax=unclassified Rhizobium TaxID=2613769 RepID=UPI003995133A
MGDVITVGLHSTWGVPVCIDTPQRLIKVVRCPEEALNALTHSWPDGVRSETYFAAKRACIAALCGNGSPHAARDKFLSACREAHINCREAPSLH